jgi:hypothetical protein
MKVSNPELDARLEQLCEDAADSGREALSSALLLIRTVQCMPRPMHRQLANTGWLIVQSAQRAMELVGVKTDKRTGGPVG